MDRAISITINVVDQKGKTSKTKVFIPNSATIPQMAAFGTELAQAIANMSTGRVTGGSICVPIDITIGNALKVAANALSDIGNKGMFIFRTAIAGLKAKFSLPTWRDDKVIAGTDTIDEADIQVAALVSFLEAGHTTSTPANVTFVNARGAEYDVLDKAKEKFRDLS